MMDLVERKEEDDNIDPDQRTVSIALSPLARDLLATGIARDKEKISVPE
jgi:hypothetical protein